jgi:flagellar hook-associated protein 3 FlgL
MLSSFYTDAAQSFSNQERNLALLQQQLSTGKAVSTASDDPAAFVTAASDTASATLLSSEDIAQTNVQSQLGVASTALQQAATVVDQLQSIALQAANATENPADYQALSEQVGTSLQQLISIGNTQGNNGEYLFSGTAKNAQPFIQTGSGPVQYMGNDGLSMVEISPGISVNAALSGSAFTSGLSGNGYASVTGATTNSGTATLLPVGLSNEAAAAAFQQGSQPITVTFATGATGALVYQASQGGVTIGSGPASSGGNIALDGVEYSLSGTPQVGDSFTIAPARQESVFGLTQTIQQALATPGYTPAQRAQTQQVLGNALAGLEQYQALIAGTNARVGLVLQNTQRAASANAQRSTADQTNASALTAANTPQVMTELSQQTSALQAAFKAFGLASGLDVFNYL